MSDRKYIEGFGGRDGDREGGEQRERREES